LKMWSWPVITRGWLETSMTNESRAYTAMNTEAQQICRPTATHVEAPQKALLSDMDLPLRRKYYPLGFAVEVVTNELAVLKAAEETFGHERLSRNSAILQVFIGVCEDGREAHKRECPPAPTRRQFNHLYSMVADTENQALLDLNTLTNFVWINKTALTSGLYFRYNFLEKTVYLLLGSSVVTDLHAGCVSKNGRGVLLCGDSGAGKSTLAYACARTGWTYTSDDTSYLINNPDDGDGVSHLPRVIGHAHRARFRPSATTLFPELEGRALTERLEGKPSLEIPTSELPGMVTANEAEVNFVVYLKRNPSGTCNLAPLPAGTASRRMRKELYSAGDVRARHEKILEVMSAVPTYELHYRDLGDAIDQLDQLVLGT
jgi:hypothetical protein